MSLCVVTATSDPERAKSCVESWGDVPLIIVVNGRPWHPSDAEATGLQATWITAPTYLGTVPAFNLGVQKALEQGYQILACLHDDLEILDPDWAKKVITHFRRHPNCGLAGFGGAIGLGDADIYQKPYEPVQLARIGFRSNLKDAEVHGMRSLLPEQVAALDGFSQIGRREFFAGWARMPDATLNNKRAPVWAMLEALGVTHHFYDGMLGCFAKRLGWETWYLPIPCHHYGGRTAVGDRGYQAWAEQQSVGGDHGFWERAHQIGYETFRDVLPIRV